MAAPDEVTLQNLAGKWTLNKNLSDDFGKILEIQGVNVLVRKAITSASVHQSITQNGDELEVSQSATSASIPGTTEQYKLDWEWRTNKDAFFGEVKGRSRWIAQDEAKTQEPDAAWPSNDSEGTLIQTEGGKPDGSWTAVQLWGFEDVQGARRHTRRVTVKAKEGEEVRVRMVYDFDP